MPRKRNKERGSLLVDASTALSILATVAMMAVPGLRTFVHESQRSAVVNELQLGVRKAARAANETGQTVTLCAAAAGGTRCAEGADWSGGWLAFVDPDGDGAMDAGEARLRLWHATNAHANIAVTAAPAVFSFRPYYARPDAGGSTHGVLTVCDRERHGGTRAIRIERGGVPTLSPVTREGCR